MRGRRRRVAVLELPDVDTATCPFPAGVLGDVWTCPDCVRVWRCGRACSSCDRTGGPPSQRAALEHTPAHVHGLRWRRAAPLERLAAWRARRSARAWHRRMHTTL